MKEGYTTKECELSVSGKHEYVTNTVTGEETCKACRTLRGAVVSPFGQEFIKEKGLNKDFSAGVIDAIIKRAQDKNIPDWLFQGILRETRSQAVIVITFDTQFKEMPTVINDFHVSAINMDRRHIVSLLLIVWKALTGQLGGTLNMQSEDIK